MFIFKKWKKNITIFLLTFVMLSNTLLGDWNGVITVQAEESINLLTNGDFETVTGELSATAITSYTAPIATGATWLGCKKDVVATTGDDTTTILDMLYSIGAYAEEGYQDGYVLKIHKGNVAENVQVKRAWVRQENVALDATTTYVLSAQVKPVSVTSANDVSGNPQMQLIITDGTNAIGKKELDVTNSNNKDNRWNTVEVEFTTTAAVTKGQVQIGVRNIESGYWLIDNVVLTKVVAQIEDGEKYVTLAEAISAATEAAASATEDVVITLLDDASEENLTIGEKITLDLNGKTLTASSLATFKGNVVDNSNEKSGLLIVGKNDDGTTKCSFSTANTQMPVYNGEGYVFATITPQETFSIEGTDDSTVYNLVFRPFFGSEKTIQNALSIDGNDIEDQFKVILRLTWKDGSQDLIYDDEMVQQVYDNKKAFYINASGVKSFDGLTITPMVVSKDKGVAWSVNSFSESTPTE